MKDFSRRDVLKGLGIVGIAALAKGCPSFGLMIDLATRDNVRYGGSVNGEPADVCEAPFDPFYYNSGEGAVSCSLDRSGVFSSNNLAGWTDQDTYFCFSRHLMPNKYGLEAMKEPVAWSALRGMLVLPYTLVDPLGAKVGEAGLLLGPEVSEGSGCGLLVSQYMVMDEVPDFYTMLDPHVLAPGSGVGMQVWQQFIDQDKGMGSDAWVGYRRLDQNDLGALYRVPSGNIHPDLRYFRDGKVFELGNDLEGVLLSDPNRLMPPEQGLIIYASKLPWYGKNPK